MMWNMSIECFAFDDSLIPNGRGQSRDSFFILPQSYLLNQGSYALQILCADRYIGVLVHTTHDLLPPKGMYDDLLKFWETSYTVSLIVQDSCIGTLIGNCMWPIE